MILCQMQSRNRQPAPLTAIPGCHSATGAAILFDTSCVCYCTVITTQNMAYAGGDPSQLPPPLAALAGRAATAGAGHEQMRTFAASLARGALRQAAAAQPGLGSAPSISAASVALAQPTPASDGGLDDVLAGAFIPRQAAARPAPAPRAQPQAPAGTGEPQQSLYALAAIVVDKLTSMESYMRSIDQRLARLESRLEGGSGGGAMAPAVAGEPAPAADEQQP